MFNKQKSKISCKTLAQLRGAEVGVAEDGPVELVSNARGGVGEHSARADPGLCGGHVEDKVGVGVAAAVRRAGAAAARGGRAHGHAAECKLWYRDAVVVRRDAAVARTLETANAVARPLLKARALGVQRAGGAYDAEGAADPGHRRREQLVHEEALLRGREVDHRGDRVVDPERLPQRRRVPATRPMRGEAAPVGVAVRVGLWRARRVLHGEGGAVVVAVVWRGGRHFRASAHAPLLRTTRESYLFVRSYQCMQCAWLVCST